ncbi:MAG: hypothetical protein DME09_18105 [Candidatus Rokuibacteriota bacterium]|nr:MAG: hypothetical protein DME09_18105 [Candidatus Rokubacteria bacterium]
MTPSDFIRVPRGEVGVHPAVTLAFLRRFAAGGFTRWQIGGVASQHNHLVSSFTAYLDAIAGRTPDAKVRHPLIPLVETT